MGVCRFVGEAASVGEKCEGVFESGGDGGGGQIVYFSGEFLKLHCFVPSLSKDGCAIIILFYYYYDLCSDWFASFGRCHRYYISSSLFLLSLLLSSSQFSNGCKCTIFYLVVLVSCSHRHLF